MSARPTTHTNNCATPLHTLQGNQSCPTASPDHSHSVGAGFKPALPGPRHRDVSPHHRAMSSRALARDLGRGPLGHARLCVCRCENATPTVVPAEAGTQNCVEGSKHIEGTQRESRGECVLDHGVQDRQQLTPLDQAQQCGVEARRGGPMRVIPAELPRNPEGKVCWDTAQRHGPSASSLEALGRYAPGPRVGLAGVAPARQPSSARPAYGVSSGGGHPAPRRRPGRRPLHRSGPSWPPGCGQSAECRPEHLSGGRRRRSYPTPMHYH